MASTLSGTTGSPLQWSPPGSGPTILDRLQGANLAAMRRYTYNLADETANPNFPESLVDSFINAGIKLVARTVPTILSTASIITVPGEPRYMLDSPLVEGKGAHIASARLSGRLLQGIDVAQVADLSMTGLPTGYYSRGASISLYPTPLEEYPLEVVFQQEPADLVDDADEPPFSSPLRELACIYAAYLMKLKDDEYNSADRLKGRFDQGIRELSGPRAGVYKGA